MARIKQLTFDHDRELSALAIWWKAVFLTPAWAFIFVLPLGAMVRMLAPGLETLTFALIMLAALLYFIADLLKKTVRISDKVISHGIAALPMQNLLSIDLGYGAYSAGSAIIPRTIQLKFKDNKRLELSLSAMDPTDASRLIDTLNRRVGHLQIDPQLERYLASKRPLEVRHIENPDQIDLPYHSHRLMEGLPQIFESALKQWARVVGPVGTMLLCTPLWLAANLAIFTAGRDYSDITALQGFYNLLVDLLRNSQANMTFGFSQLDIFFNWLAESWLAAFTVIPLACFLCVYALSTTIRPNRLTLTADYISLDFWTYLYCVTSNQIPWAKIAQVELVVPGNSADPKRRKVLFKDNKGKALLSIPMANLEPDDRSRLLQAIENFAPTIKMSAELIETLSQSNDKSKSYTELWLSSLNSSNSLNLEPLANGHILQGRYHIESKLAVGGEGVAYLARDMHRKNEGIAPLVVLKETLIPPYVDRDVQKESLERFEREARLLKSLDSEFIVGLQQYFIEDKRCYLALDYVEGESLRRLVEKEALPLPMILDLTAQMAGILDFLHSREIVHRDFTPDNLILQKDGRLKLIDFNVASDQSDGKTGTIVGKHAYVPPEQFRGKACKASDIYALGATVFFLCHRQDPEPISQSKLDPDIFAEQKELSQIVHKCTALSADERLSPQQIIGLLDQLEPAVIIKVMQPLEAD